MLSTWLWKSCLLFSFLANWSSSADSSKEKYGTELLCAQAAQFIPDVCRYNKVKQACKKICREEGGNSELLSCGEKHIRHRRRQRRIVGGTLSQPGEWPWRVSLMCRNKLKQKHSHYCGGTILSEYFVLTAWHCFDENQTSFNASDWVVISGENELQDNKTLERAIKVRKIIRHTRASNHQYKFDNKRYAVIDHDIAILALDEPINIDGDRKAAICLPEMDRKVNDYQTVFVSGWGHTVFKGNVSNQLRHAGLPVVPTEKCNSEQVFNNTIDGELIVCAGFKRGGIDACYYDSGGSLDYKIDGRWYAIGIVSSGYECARPNAYGLYTNISNYREWIIDSILKVDEL